MGDALPLVTNLLMFRSRVLLKAGGPKAEAEGGAESQPSCIPPADALLICGSVV